MPDPRSIKCEHGVGSYVGVTGLTRPVHASPDAPLFFSGIDTERSSAANPTGDRGRSALDRSYACHTPSNAEVAMREQSEPFVKLSASLQL